MSVTTTYPGVYTREAPSGIRTVAPVPTSIGMFIGRTSRGPINQPFECPDRTTFARIFGADSLTSDMWRYVNLWFTNEGSTCVAMRIADGATSAEVTLNDESGGASLKLTAKDVGLAGEEIRAVVTYSGAQPESTFNIEIYRSVRNASTGELEKQDVEKFMGLVMVDSAPTSAESVITQNSKLVAAEMDSTPTALRQGYSQGGQMVGYVDGDNTDRRAQWEPFFPGPVPPQSTGPGFEISVDGGDFVSVTFDFDASNLLDGALNVVTDPNFIGEMETQMAGLIDGALNAAGQAGTVSVSFFDGPEYELAPPTPIVASAPDHVASYLHIESNSTGDVFIRPHPQNDLAVGLKLGSAQGGLEVSAASTRRPAPSGISFRPTFVDAVAAPPEVVFDNFGNLLQSDIASLALDVFDRNGQPIGNETVLVDLVTGGQGTPPHPKHPNRAFVVDSSGGLNGILEKLGLLAAAVNKHRDDHPDTFKWHAELWGYRLVILPTDAAADNGLSVALATAPTNLQDTGDFDPVAFSDNVNRYSVGAGGSNLGSQVTAGAPASDGAAPKARDYDRAYEIIDAKVDIFNLLILPPDRSPAVPLPDLYARASTFCKQRHAFLIMDPPDDWDTAQDAKDGINASRTGVVTDHAAMFFPRIRILEDGREHTIGPAGAIGGLMGRNDVARGIWKAAAGTEAALYGVRGLDRKLSDGENGLLNPRGLNVIRVFPNGIVSWGARCLAGDDGFSSEYKYVPIRRVALHIKESLKRGLQWAVFEPNDEPLWAQIRLAAGSFMQGLYRKGAFQGSPEEAWFVKVDSETTTQTDRRLGIVNVIVGFAPVKPAEYILVELRQVALPDGV